MRSSRTYPAIVWLLILNSACDAQPSRVAAVDNVHRPVVGTCVAISSVFNSLPLVEPHISAHPGNANHLLAAAMVVTDINRPYESCRLLSFVSSDGGNTWRETVHDWWGYDPWTAIASNGTAIMSWIGTPGSFQDKYPIVLFTSRNGGVDWSTEIQTLPGMHDGTKLAEWKDTFYFTTVRFRESEGADVVLFERKNDSGFVERAILDGKGVRLNFCEPVIAEDGVVVVPAASRDAAWVQHFDTGKRAMSGPKTIVNRPGNWRGYARMVGGSKSPVYSSHVYFVRAMGNSGLRVDRSTDGGHTWQSDIRVDRHQPDLIINALVPSAAVNDQGVLGISWVNQKEDRSGSQVWFTSSHDGGVSFTSPVQLSEATDPRTKANGDVANKFPGGGHYLGLAARADGSFQAIWSDSRSGVFQLHTCTIRVSQ